MPQYPTKGDQTTLQGSGYIDNNVKLGYHLYIYYINSPWAARA